MDTLTICNIQSNNLNLKQNMTDSIIKGRLPNIILCVILSWRMPFAEECFRNFDVCTARLLPIQWYEFEVKNIYVVFSPEGERENITLNSSSRQGCFFKKHFTYTTYNISHLSQNYNYCPLLHVSHLCRQLQQKKSFVAKKRVII